MIYVFYNNDPLANDLGGGAEHFRGIFRALARSGLPFRLVGARLQHEIDDPRIEYISCSSNFFRFWLALWRWFWSNRKKLGPCDVLHFHRNYAAWPKLVLAPGPERGRILVSYHNVTGRVLEGRLGRVARPIRALMLLFERRVVGAADAIVCVSERDRRTLAREVAEKPFARAEVVPAAFDARLFERRPRRPPPPDLARKLLVLGRISRQKNLPLAVAVLERLIEEGEDYTLTIAGDGEEARALLRRIAASPARDRIRWIGRQPHDRVPDLFATHGILLLTSRFEASPTVVKEALASCRPVVTTDVGDVGLWLEHGRTGFICPPDVERLARAVRAASALVESGAYRCPSCAAFAEGAIMDRLIALYRRLSTG
ncbi:MAG: glycosyltransferase family 4 protein [Geminicoccaceae bacterium]|nr:glycosyltransferase family 4 protein [Geminicoccaceae bacterium]MDW8124179.1 glycosyltransferase family 4 protein [Geminicoccaceae bacterium]